MSCSQMITNKVFKRRAEKSFSKKGYKATVQALGAEEVGAAIPGSQELPFVSNTSTASWSTLGTKGLLH